MATKKTRGTKRTCQSDECGARFYDLGRSPIVCPICGSLYELASGPVTAAGAADKAPRRFKGPEYEPDKAVPEEEIPEAAESKQVVPVDLEEEETITPDEDDTVFEEEDEEDGDVSNIIDGPLDGDEKP
jgi:uncharacterized protein (TIGR02300 family)